MAQLPLPKSLANVTPSFSSLTLPLSPLPVLAHSSLMGHDDHCTCDEFIIYNSHNFEGSTVAPIRIMFYHNKFWEDFQGETLESLRSGFTEGKSVLQLKIKGQGFLNVMVRIWVWVPKDLAWALTSKFPNTKLLGKNDKTYVYTSNLFLTRIAKVDPEAVVTNIHEIRISGSHVRACWDEFEKQIEINKTKRGRANVVYAWYATSREEVASILSHGFQLPHAENVSPLRPSIKYVISILLAWCCDFVSELSCSAMQYPVAENGEKHLILCQVVLGSVEKLELEFNQTGSSRQEYDTGSNDPNNPKCCKSSAIVPVKWKPFPCEKSIIPKLVFQIKKRMPIVNVPLLMRYMIPLR
ncbi:inactive poly [Sesbania bispinosa]|nr:inactive poly [Sesbania bispinosa]